MRGSLLIQLQWQQQNREKCQKEDDEKHSTYEEMIIITEITELALIISISIVVVAVVAV